MALVKPASIQKHPIAWGLVWAALTLGSMSLIEYGRDHRLLNLLIAIPIWAVGGLAWGYGMKWFFDRRAGKQ
jgi:hypothetical protein